MSFQSSHFELDFRNFPMKYVRNNPETELHETNCRVPNHRQAFLINF